LKEHRVVSGVLRSAGKSVRHLKRPFNNVYKTHQYVSLEWLAFAVMKRGACSLHTAAKHVINV